MSVQSVFFMKNYWHDFIQLTVADNDKDNDEDTTEMYSVFCLTVHFLECLYDPYFVWRKRLKGFVLVLGSYHCRHIQYVSMPIT